MSRSGQCFTRQQRLLDEYSFKPLFAAPQWRVGGPVFLLLVSPSATDQARLGLVIPKKRIRRASQRNLVKRIARESFRRRQLPAVDIIVMVRSSLARVDRQLLSAELEQLWDKLLAKIGRD